MERKPNYVVSVSGGAGKHVMFTAVAKNIKATYPNHNLIVISPYPDLLINIPYIDRVYKTGTTPYMYDDFVGNHPDNIVSAAEPYIHNNYLLEKEHLIQTWSRTLEVVPNLEVPELAINRQEQYIFQERFGKQLGDPNKPIMIINPFGGPQKDEQPYNWCRDLHPEQAQLLVNHYSSTYNVVHVARPDQKTLDNTIKFSGNLRELCCLLLLSSKRILIDSFCQHAAAALRLRSTVLWITNKPKVFGYNTHTNIIARSPDNLIHRVDSLFQPNNWEGSWNHYYPYNDNSIFDLNEIIQSID